MTDFLFRGSLEELDPAVYELIQLEAERQYRKLILIPSESTAPLAVREAMGSRFQNLYAEGYPDEETRWMKEEEILDYETRLAHYRRYADPRYYKGVEYADVVEALARRRCAEAFATPAFPADRIYVNVQPLSGAPANNAVYTGLVSPGDTIMGMNLLHGGHLTHGSSANRSGKLFNVVHYNVDPETEQINYDTVAELAQQHRPKLIIAGYSSYPWMPDWQKFRVIADTVGALLLADISHIAGLVSSGAVASPVGLAQVITFTTHKTLTGPRGAVVMTTDAALARKLDRAVFPGEQGGPHVHIFAALATTFKLAQTEQFKQLQRQIIKNCRALNDRLAERSFHMVFGGTDTHLTNLDCKTITGPGGAYLSGDMAARILDIAGLVMNRNTIPGDKSALQASGIRMGTPWMTQRGLDETDMRSVADVIADVLQATMPYTVETRQGPALRAKVDFGVLESAKLKVRELATRAGVDFEPTRHGYPHFYYIDDPFPGQWGVLELAGAAVQSFANYAFSSDFEALADGQSQQTCLSTTQGSVEGVLTRVDRNTCRLSVPSARASLAAAWLRGLSDGYARFDPDLARRIPGPLVVRPVRVEAVQQAGGERIAARKPYFAGIHEIGTAGEPLPAFHWEESEPQQLRRTSLYETHRKMGARMVPFAGWEMPVQYTSIVEEHLATRQAAGLFDVSHMGVYQAEGPHAAAFLDSVCGNDVADLAVGESLYTHFLDPDANVIDDTLVYCRDVEKYLVVVNASNDDKDWAWLNAVRDGSVLVDPARPWARAFGRDVVLRNLRDLREGSDMRVDIALQGPKSRDILLALGPDPQSRRRVMALKRTELCEAAIGGFDLVVSRTGYTGERMAFELFVHPEQAPALWDRLVEAGAPLGLKPCGLGARDSLRTEAGLPLYGHEMGGQLNLGVGEAGFGSYVKVYKPWFIGREAFIRREETRKSIVTRFRFNEKGVRMAHPGDPAVDPKGRVAGVVTSCAIDQEGFLTGQIYLDGNLSTEGTQVNIFQSAPKTAGKAPAELKKGDRVTLPTPATILSRFPKTG
jgi:glycine hydroxymethyltransferase